MKKETGRYLLPIIIIGFFFIFFLINFPFTGKVIEEHPIPSNCSDENIQDLWEFIFKGNPENLTIVPLYNTSNETEVQEMDNLSLVYGGCPVYIAYEINGTQIKMLNGINMWFFSDVKVILAYVGNFTEEAIINLTNESNSEFGGQALTTSSGFVFEEEYIKNNIVPRKITTIPEAKSHFESLYNIQVQNWTKEYDEELGDIGMYNFVENQTLENITLFGENLDPEGMVARMGITLDNYSLDVYLLTEMSMYGTLINLAKKEYASWKSIINTSTENITVKINGSRLNLAGEFDLFSKGPSGIQKIEIQENNKTIVEANINFTEDQIDWTNITLKVQKETDDAGFLIINGLNATKNVTIDKLDSDSDSVCIKDQEINFITEISEDCDGTNEYLLECPRNLSHFTCEIINDTFFVTGLEHSAVLELIPNEPELCIQNWDCTEWSDSDNNCGRRNCIDLNTCENISGMPNEYERCPVICVPDWECTEYEPEKCPKEETRTRTCEDNNGCGTNEGKPRTSQTCERKSGAWIWILSGLTVVLLALILFLNLTSPKRHKPLQQQTHPPETPEKQLQRQYQQQAQQLQNQQHPPQKFQKDKTFQDYNREWQPPQ